MMVQWKGNDMEDVDFSTILCNAYERIKEIDEIKVGLNKERDRLEEAMKKAVKGIVGDDSDSNWDDEGVDVSVGC